MLTDIERWPASACAIERDRFDRIVSGKATELDTLLAPAYRSLVLSRGRPPKYRATIVHRFFEHPVASELVRLDVAHTDWPAAVAVHVAEAARLANLETLSFDCTSIGDDGIAALAGAAQLTKLRRLALYMCGMTKATLPALSRSAFAPQLEALAIGGNRLGVDVEALGRFAHLQRLSLRGDKTVDASAVAALLESAALPELVRLDVADTSVTDAGSLSSLRPGLVVATERVPSSTASQTNES